jgi:Uma2 family endonuclease
MSKKLSVYIKNPSLKRRIFFYFFSKLPSQNLKLDFISLVKHFEMATVTKFSDLDLTKEYSYSDYLLWQFQERVELIKGRVFKLEEVTYTIHQKISGNLSGELYLNFKGKSESVFAAPFDVRLPIPSAKKDSTVVQPDLCIICDESKLDKRGCNGTPDLMVEIISPNNSKHDVHTKKRV